MPRGAWWVALALTLGIRSYALDYRCARQVFLRGSSNATDAPRSNVPGSRYSISPPLPAGLTLDPISGVISGAPTGVTAMVDYVVTATNCLGIQHATVSLRTADGYPVNDLSDTAYLGPGCVSASNTCSLRAAFGAIAAAPMPNVILLPPGTVTLTAELASARAVDIYGDCAQGTVLDANLISRVFNFSGGPITLEALTLRNGKTTGAGGGVQMTNRGASNVDFILTDVTVQNNSATAEGGGLDLLGADAGQEVNLIARRSHFLGNSSDGVGGGISFGNNFTSGQIDECTFEDNATVMQGAGIFYAGNAIAVTRSLFARNQAPGANASAFDINYFASGVESFVNDTFFQNSGALAVIYQADDLRLTNCTFANNLSLQSVFNPSGKVTLTNNLFVNNLTVASGGDAGTLKICTGGATFVSGGGNVSDGPLSDCRLGANDLAPATARLGPLENNGGFTETLALLPGSPGEARAVVSSCPADDQRGAPRPLDGGRCDVGAFELGTDAGADGGATTDAGTAATTCPGPDAGNSADGGVVGPRNLEVRCGCDSAASPVAAVALFALLARGRGARRRALQPAKQR
jgi:hypothetical protein